MIRTGVLSTKIRDGYVERAPFRATDRRSQYSPATLPPISAATIRPSTFSLRSENTSTWVTLLEHLGVTEGLDLTAGQS